MLKTIRRYRSHVAALVVSGCLGMAAHSSLLDPQSIVITAPSEVIAGNPILGYVTGIDGMCVINGGIFGSGPLGPPIQGVYSPTFFMYPTFEYQAPAVAEIHARDIDSSATASVILK